MCSSQSVHCGRNGNARFAYRLELIVLLKREELFEDQVDATDDLYELLDVEYPMVSEVLAATCSVSCRVP